VRIPDFIRRLPRVFLAAVLCGLALPAFAQVGISPAYYDLSLEEAGKTQTFRIFNYTAEPKHVRVSLAPWDVDANNQPYLLPSGPTTLDQWVVVNPVEFDIKASSSQAVRFTVRPAVELPPGEHRVMLVFDEVVPPMENAKMRSRFQFRSALYVQVGKPVRDGSIESVTADPAAAHITVKNSGNANVRFSGQFGVWEIASYPGTQGTEIVQGLGSKPTTLAKGQLVLDVLPGNPVLPGKTNSVTANFGATRLKPGRYMLDLNGKLGDAPLDRAIEFTVTEPPR
jgi:P pilus assembly chaperone PapD